MIDANENGIGYEQMQLPTLKEIGKFARSIEINVARDHWGSISQCLPSLSDAVNKKPIVLVRCQEHLQSIFMTSSVLKRYQYNA